MRQYKEMIIRKPKIYSMPTLVLNGQWLADIGFTTGTLVSVRFTDSCLILSTDTNIANVHSVIIVKNKRVRGRVRPQLMIDGLTLKAYGLYEYNVRIGLTIDREQIQIQKINRFSSLETS